MNRSRRLEVGECSNSWRIRKRLFKSDVGKTARLTLPSELAESHILRNWNADQIAQIEQGLPVLVWDCDTNTEHVMLFKRWNRRAYVFIGDWTEDFVKRRGLECNDEIGLYWDVDSSRLDFSLLHRAPSQQLLCQDFSSLRLQ